MYLCVCVCVPPIFNLSTQLRRYSIITVQILRMPLWMSTKVGVPLLPAIQCFECLLLFSVKYQQQNNKIFRDWNELCGNAQTIWQHFENKRIYFFLTSVFIIFKIRNINQMIQQKITWRTNEICHPRNSQQWDWIIC